MAKNVIFFVHGVGRHEKGWARIKGGPIQALNQASKHYTCFNGLELEKLVDMVEIRYDDIFDQHLDQWDDLATSLKAVPGGSASFNKVINLLSEVGDDRNLFAQYGGDVLLYAAFDLIAKRVRLRVNSIISNKIHASLKATKDKPGPMPEFGIVGHSLGTTIVHDCLETLATNEWLPGGDLSASDIKLTPKEKEHLQSLKRRSTNPFSTDVFTWNSVHMISNTSRLLHQTSNNPYNSVVRPGKAVRYFINIEHELDPVCKVKRFRIPNDWSSRARHIEVDHIHEANIHGYAHYLKHPKAHRRLFWYFLPQFTATCNDNAKEWSDEFPQYAGQFNTADKKNAIKRKLNTLIDNYKDSSLTKFRTLFEEFTKKIGKIA